MRSERILIDGPAGAIETVFDYPPGASEVAPRGLALVAHPHPLYGGTLDNKVAQIIAKTFVELGYVSVRPNFRGAGASQGAHDDGNGETDDLVAVIAFAQRKLMPGHTTPAPAGAPDPTHAQASASDPTHAPASASDLPLVLAGFSFGSLVVSRVAKRVTAERMVFVGTAVTRGKVEDVPPGTIVIHGELDDTVPLDAVLRWARPLELPVIVIPAADHFFHRRLHIIKGIIMRAWKV